ncbi:unnamed protein product [Haemonchus placei]|uniref:Uncharacterized protein n=1 Tax=Haemonchus placei TaxID=6290 RepID=A0A3P7W2C7_HAEPC|nr:unnamed protein product [Haemonchus placei]
MKVIISHKVVPVTAWWCTACHNVSGRNVHLFFSFGCNTNAIRNSSGRRDSPA